MDENILSREERESFVANGFLGPFKVYDQAEAKEIGKKIRVQTQNKELAPFPTADINYDRHIDVPLLTKHVSHPAIVRFVDHGLTAAGEPYLVTEWLEGESLAERLRRGVEQIDGADLGQLADGRLAEIGRARGGGAEVHGPEGHAGLVEGHAPVAGLDGRGRLCRGEGLVGDLGLAGARASAERGGSDDEGEERGEREAAHRGPLRGRAWR